MKFCFIVILFIKFQKQKETIRTVQRDSTRVRTKQTNIMMIFYFIRLKFSSTYMDLEKITVK